MFLLFLGWVAAAAPVIERPDDDTATVCFVRTYNYVGSAVRWHLVESDREIGLLGNRRVMCFDADPGTYEVHAWGRFANNATPFADVNLLLKRKNLGSGARITLYGGQITYVRIRMKGKRFTFSKEDEAWYRRLGVRESRKASAKRLVGSE